MTRKQGLDTGKKTTQGLLVHAQIRTHTHKTVAVDSSNQSTHTHVHTLVGGGVLVTMSGVVGVVVCVATVRIVAPACQRTVLTFVEHFGTELYPT